MNLFHKRHLALFCALFAAASIGGCFLYTAQKFLLGLVTISVVCLLLLLFVFLRKYRAALLKCALCFLFISLSLWQSYLIIDKEREGLSPELEKSSVREMVIIEELTRSDYYASFNVRIPVQGKFYTALLECDYSCDYSVGDTLQGKVLIQSITAAKEVYNQYLAQGIYIAVISQEEPLSVIDSGYTDLGIRLRTLNRNLSSIFEKELGGDAANLASAISLGNKSLLDNDILRDFRRTGLSHVLAISGMHLSVIILLLDIILRRTGIKKEVRCVLVLFFALFYVALTGFSSSTVRAFIMTSFVYTSFLLRRDNDAITSLFFALFLILFISPPAVWDIGLWLSFLAVLGILTANYFIQFISNKLYESKIHKFWIKILVYLSSAVIITLAANVFVCFPMWMCFQELSLVSVISNLLISSLVAVFLFGSLAFLLIYFIPYLTYATPFIASVLRFLAKILLGIVSHISHWENVTVSLRYPFAGVIIALFSVLLGIALIVPLKRKIWIPVIPLVASLLFSGCLVWYRISAKDELTVDYRCFNESEMILLTTTNDAVICDLSTGGSTYWYETVLQSKNRYATEISAVVLTHYHTHHIRTFAKNAENTMIRALYLPVPATTDEYHLMQSLIHTAKQAGCRVVLYDREQDFSPAPNITLNLSENVYLKRSTHPTFSLSVSAFNEQLVYVAESAHENPTLHNWTNRALGSADYVIFGKHGPVSRSIFAYENLSNAQTVFVADDKVLSFFDIPDNCVPIVQSTEITIRMKP